MGFGPLSYLLLGVSSIDDPASLPNALRLTTGRGARLGYLAPVVHHLPATPSCDSMASVSKKTCKEFLEPKSPKKAGSAQHPQPSAV